MALTKINFFLGAVFTFIVVALALLQFGNGLDKKNMLDEESQTYIEKYAENLESYNIQETLDQNSNTNVSNPLTAENGERSILQDIFAVWNKIVDILQGTWDFVKLIFNLPSFILQTLKIPFSEFGFIVNAFVWTMLIGVTIMLIGKAK